jgi:hypothetical protein
MPSWGKPPRRGVASGSGGFWCDFKWTGRVGRNEQGGDGGKKVDLGMELLEAAAACEGEGVGGGGEVE